MALWAEQRWIVRNIFLLVQQCERMQDALLAHALVYTHHCCLAQDSQYLRCGQGCHDRAFLEQGSIRQNLDPLGQYSDRDMIRALKDVHLWEILCGISLSQAKEEEESPRTLLMTQGREAGSPD